METISSIELLPSGELLLRLSGPGKPSYQHVYREAAGVYWDPENQGFKSTELKDWSCSKWYSHIVEVCGNVGISLRLSDESQFVNLPAGEREKIIEATAT